MVGFVKRYNIKFLMPIRRKGNVIKKVLYITITVCLLAGLFIVPATAAQDLLQDGEKLLDPVYLMDFSPASDGKFYDAPEGTEGRMEVSRADNPADIIFLSGSESNVDNQIINTLTGGNTSGIYASRAEKDLYVTFSKGTTANDMNTGASGAAEDYCLKSVDASSSSSYIAWTRINFPETYGGEQDKYSKYRFEMAGLLQCNNTNCCRQSYGRSDYNLYYWG